MFCLYDPNIRAGIVLLFSSDAFIQAQQQLARWTSEEGGVQHRPPQQPPPPPTSSSSGLIIQQQQQQQQQSVEQLPMKHRGYYPSPTHNDNGHDHNGEIVNAQSQQQIKLICPELRGIDVNHMPNIKKCPLDDKISLDCNINNDILPIELNTNNTSDNENTALLPPTHFPEYKH